MKVFLLLIFSGVLIGVLVEGQLYSVIGSILTSIVNLSSFQQYLVRLYPDRQFEIGLRKKWDFIVVGSGPSGSVVATRLSENRHVNVLVLEAGEEASALTDVPIVVSGLGTSKYDYGYRTEPQSGFCRGCTDNRLKWERGKALGGSTVVNYMMHIRGNRRDYDLWCRQGNSGWCYDDLLPYFKKIENAQDLGIPQDTQDGYRGTQGPVNVAYVPWRTQISEIFVRASQQTGYEHLDYNGRQQLGVSFVQTTTKRGMRVSAEKAYLRPVRGRSNLVVQTKARVTKVLIQDGRAYGVEYVHDGVKYRAFTSKEVILSAGVLNSPQLLMLSGVGPGEELEKFGIPVIKNLPVGKKVYDHVTFPLIVYQVNESVTINTLEALNPINLIEFEQGRGLYTSPGGVEVVVFTKTHLSTDPDPLYPDIELLVLGGTVSDDMGVSLRNIYNIPPSIYDVMFKPLEGKNCYQATPILLHPRSFGNVSLRSADPSDAPLLYANYFSDPTGHDMKTMIAGIRAFQKINQSPALRQIGATLVDIPAPGCECLEFDSDGYWECAVRQVVGSYFHMVATCKMGGAGDPEAVVDPDLRVYGVDGLRVVDTSVIPVITSGHTAAPAYVIGEKGADILKRWWGI